jgi:putative nucleotidyltransferase with HDIG domain
MIAKNERSRPFINRIWLASLFNLLCAGIFSSISYSTILNQPIWNWQDIQPSVELPKIALVFVFHFLILTFFNLLLRRNENFLFLRFRAIGSIYLSFILVTLSTRILLSYSELSIFSAPFIFSVILFTPLLGQNLGFVIHLLSLALIAPMTDFTPGIILVPLATGWSAALLLDKESGPIRMFIVSVVGLVIGYLFLSGAELFFPSQIDSGLNFSSDLFGLTVGTLASGLLASILSYFTTTLFGMVPSSRLRSLLDMDNPLLKDLAEKAPGTFQHSLALANLAEKVADDIGADARLVRAGAYYHDIGKMHQPKYFIENQKGENPHNDLAPEVSAEKLRNHLDQGIIIARGANLPERVIDFIIEHHGRSTMEYFLDKAYRTNGAKPEIDNFLYSGRNPTSRETAILMIADSIEAASRTLHQPGQEEIEILVRTIVFRKLLHGYLDESGLTIRNLKGIGTSLIKFLQAQFHVRIEYPWQKKLEERPPIKLSADTNSGIMIPEAGRRVAQPVAPAAEPSKPSGDSSEQQPETNKQKPGS